MKMNLKITIHYDNFETHISPNKLAIMLILIGLLSILTEMKNGPFIAKIMLAEIYLLIPIVN